MLGHQEATERDSGSACAGNWLRRVDPAAVPVPEPGGPNNEQDATPVKVLLIVIDAATPHVVCPAVATGRLPTLQQLARAGRMHEASVSIFPSITPAATSSIITGCYPAQHGIAGASWYDEASEEVAYYGDDFWVIAREGFGPFVRDFLLRLNGDRLKAPTLFQSAERAGLKATCLNYLVFKGDHRHEVDVPAWLSMLPGVSPREVVQGPSVLALGDFVVTPSPRGRSLSGRSGILHRFGMDDSATGKLLAELAEEGFPDFTVAYFADNDFKSHDVGPFEALPVIGEVDRMLGAAFDAGGGLARVLEDVCVIVTSDHGHCDVLADQDAAVIRLDQLLGTWRQARLGKPWQDDDELMICPNMRAAQLYVHAPTPAAVEAIAAAMLADPRVDQVLWRASLTGGDADAYTAVSDRGRLEFRRAGEGPGARDAFGTRWAYTGDRAVLGLDEQDGELESYEYPNPFERIAGVLDLEKSGEMWVTARPGCEFELPGGSAHAGGASHGALHRLDSLSPVIIAGPPGRPHLPRDMRLVDIAGLCRRALGLPERPS